MLRRGTTLAASLIVGAFLVAAAPAAASVTIGSDLMPNPTFPECGNCTMVNLSLPDQQVASPIDGVVTGWRVRISNATTPMRLRVLRPEGSGVFLGVNSSTTQTPVSPGAGVQTSLFGTQQPIKTGDLIGLDQDPSGSDYIATGTSGANSAFWSPPLADGAALSPNFPATGPTQPEFMFNATIEADCDHDGLGDETQDPDISSCNPPAKDTTPPNTTIGKGPKKVIHAKGAKTKVKFTFASSETGATFKCKLDAKPFSTCTSPKTFKVKPGKHTFQVEATDAAGNLDATPAKRKFKVLPAVQ